MSYKEYPDCRICILDYKPCILKSLKNTQSFCKETKIIFDYDNKDVKKLLYHFTISEFCSTYTRHQTTFAKIFGVYDIDLNKDYKGILQKIFKVLPVPFCFIKEIEHPDTKYSAIKKLNLEKIDYQRLKKFASKNNLVKLQEQILKQNIFINGVVDFTRVLN